MEAKSSPLGSGLSKEPKKPYMRAAVAFLNRGGVWRLRYSPGSRLYERDRSSSRVMLAVLTFRVSSLLRAPPSAVLRVL